MSFDTLCVIGLGYIGLPTATMFASHGKTVIGVDVNQHAVDTINQGKIHIVEPDLDKAVHEAVSAGRLRATTQPEPADAFLVAVPTPFKKELREDGIPEPDLSYIEAASKALAPVLKKGNLVILESTSPVGATEQMAAWLAEARSDLSFPQQAGDEADILIAHCPERVLPGRVMIELIENDRIVGGMTTKCAEAAVELYQTFVKGECLTTNARTAEMAKLTENAFRDVNIAFANELSLICDEQDINVWELIKLANRHPRVNILQPGPGVGGHCIAVDPWFIAAKSPALASLIIEARKINDTKPQWVIKKINDVIAEEALKESFEKEMIVVAFYGLSFKPDIDDLRESPAVKIVEKYLKQCRGRVKIIEPNISLLPKALSGAELMSVGSNVEADVHVLLVDHKEFKGVKVGSGRVIDTRGIWSQV